MTITMTEAKIAQAADFIYSELSSPSSITREECDIIARRVQELWQDTEEPSWMQAGGKAAPGAKDPTPASQAPPGGDLYGAIDELVSRTSDP